jgi:putative ABC transport system permease protein
MSVIWYKVWADLWDNKARTLLAVLSIAVGVFAIGVTFGMSDQLLTGLDKAHQASSPGHFSMYLYNLIDADKANMLKKIDGVEDIALANRFDIQYKLPGEEKWRDGEVVTRKDFDSQTYELINLISGNWPVRKQFGIERLSSQQYGLDVGDTVIFKIGDRSKQRHIAGTMQYNMVIPPEFGGNALFFAHAEGLEMFGISPGEYNQLIVRVSPYSAELTREVASRIKNQLAKDKISVDTTIFKKPTQHWARPMVKGITRVLQILAAISLIASVVLVFNTVMAIVTQQTDQIGVLKAIGATQISIVRIYFSLILVYGLLALFVALPLGTGLAFVVTRALLMMFNIDYEQFQASNNALLWQTFAALGVPLLAGLWPVLSGTAITVREAIASYGIGGDFGHTRFDRFIERLGNRFLSAPYAVALGNMFRRKGRLLLTQLVLILAGVMFLVVMSLSSSVTQTLNNVLAEHHYDFIIGFETNERIDRILATAGRHPGVKRIETWFLYTAGLLKEGQRLKEAGVGAELVGIPNGSDSFKPRIVAGRWLQPNDDRIVVINADTARDNNINLGDTVTLDLSDLDDHEWKVAGFYKNVFNEDGGSVEIYANLDAVFKATKKHNQGNHIRVLTHNRDEVYVKTVLNQLTDMFEAKKIGTVGSITLHKLRQDAEKEFAVVINMLLFLAVVMAMVGGIGLMGALSINVVERTREIGVLRAVGAKSSIILGMFVMEGVLQGLLSWLIVIPLSLGLAPLMAKVLGKTMFQATLDYQYSFEAVLTWLVIILIISVLASILPAQRATQISVRESLAYA